MLIDILLNNPIENVTDENLGPLRQRLKLAHKFDLAPDFAAAADELSVDLTTISNALPHCRLPFQRTWIEVAQQSRPHFAAAEIHMPNIQAIPLRVGFLLESPDLKQATFAAYQFWTMAKLPDWPQASHIGMRFDPSGFDPAKAEVEMAAQEAESERVAWRVPPSPEWLKASPTEKAKLAMSTHAVMAPFTSPGVIGDMIGGDTERVARTLVEIGIVDWAGESTFLLAVLALLNTLNATQSVATNLRRLNVSRAKARKPPLADHYVLKIHPRLKRHVVGDSAAHGHRALRGHVVRGHFKVRKTGIYFWRPHARGEGKAADRTYLVE